MSVAAKPIQRNGKGRVQQGTQWFALTDPFTFVYIKYMGGERNRVIQTQISIPFNRESYDFPSFMKLPCDIINTIVSFMDLGTLLCFSSCRKNWRNFIKTILHNPYSDSMYYIPYTTHSYKIKYTFSFTVRKM